MEVTPENAPGSFLHTNKNQMKSDVCKTNCCRLFKRHSKLESFKEHSYTAISLLFFTSCRNQFRVAIVRG